MPRADKQRAAPPKQGAAPYAKPHTCPHCAAGFGRAGTLTTHVRVVHEKRKDYACPHCADAFGHASALKRHVHTVTRHPGDSAAFAPGGSIGLQMDLAASHVVLR